MMSYCMSYHGITDVFVSNEVRCGNNRVYHDVYLVDDYGRVFEFAIHMQPGGRLHLRTAEDASELASDAAEANKRAMKRTSFTPSMFNPETA